MADPFGGKNDNDVFGGNGDNGVSINNMPTSKRLCKTYDDFPQHTHSTTICITQYDIPGTLGYCEATWNKSSCKSCTHFPSGICFGNDHDLLDDSNSPPSTGGFKLDCSIPTSTNIHVCNDKVSILNFQNTNRNGYGYNNNNNRSSGGGGGSSSSGGISSFGVIFTIVLIFRLIACFARRTGENTITRRVAPFPHQRRRRQGHADYQQVEMLPVVTLAEDGDINSATARELLVSTSDFASYDNEHSKDCNVQQIQQYVTDKNYKAIQEFFQGLRAKYPNDIPTLNKLRSFYVEAIVSQVAQSWGENVGAAIDNQDITTAPSSLLVFSPLLDEWAHHLKQNNNSDNNDNKYMNDNCDDDYHIIRAEAYIRWAWHARTGNIAENVSNHQFQLFHERLQQATLELKRVSNYNDALFIAAAITICRGLGPRHQSLQLIQHNDRNDNNIFHIQNLITTQLKASNDTLNYLIHVRALQYFCKKWHGSHTAMFDFVRSTTKQLSTTTTNNNNNNTYHPLWVLIPMAHYERILFFEPTSIFQRRSDYWKQPSVKEEIWNAYQNAFCGDSGDNTISESNWITSDNCLASRQLEHLCRNWFAYALIQINKVPQAKCQIRLISTCPVTPHPWGSVSYYKRVIETICGFETNHFYTRENNNDDNYNGFNNNATITTATATTVQDDDDGNDSSVPIVTAVAEIV